jgi:inorganic pyrophosphatase
MENVDIVKMENLDIVVEIPYNSFVKYEFDYSKGYMRCDRVLNTSMTYPGNYGFIPETLAGDGDPLDVIMICDYQLFPGSIVSTKVIGVLLTEDEKGQDEKIIVVPSSNVDFNFDHVKKLSDLPASYGNKIEHFFKHYKDNEKNKWVKVNGFGDKNTAFQIIYKSKETFLKAIENSKK